MTFKVSTFAGDDSTIAYFDQYHDALGFIDNEIARLTAQWNAFQGSNIFRITVDIAKVPDRGGVDDNTIELAVSDQTDVKGMLR